MLSKTVGLINIKENYFLLFVFSMFVDLLVFFLPTEVGAHAMETIMAVSSDLKIQLIFRSMLGEFAQCLL
jgi:hypothetical protein